MLRQLLALFRKPQKPVAAPPAPPSRPAALPSWQAMRTPQLEWDRALRAESQRWLSLLPEEVKPNELCSAYPRIANRLALIWPERAAIKSYFDDLMIDKRGGRVGFSQGIRDELLRLRGFHDSSMSSPQAVREWKDRMASSSEAGARRRAGSAADGRSS